MKIYELFTKEALDKALADKMVKVEKHPTLDLYIYNYTANTQFAWEWNDVTLNCRGLIVDGEDNIVARPFKKFFSYEQLDGKLPNVDGDILDYKVEEKMDGSMLIIVNYKGNVVCATRGSFVSDQAKKAYEFLTPELLTGTYKGDSYVHEFKQGFTYIFEIIYKQNRIVVDYDFEGLVLLLMTDTELGGEYDSVYLPWRRPRKYNFESLEEILAYEEPNLEGFVLKFQNGERVKIKLEDYKRLHRLITGVSEKTVWEAMRNGTLEELLEGTPDEFYDFVEGVRAELQEKYEAIEREAKDNFVDLGDRKANALHYQTLPNAGLLFNMLDGKDYSQGIWKQIRPEVTRVFKMVSEDAN